MRLTCICVRKEGSKVLQSRRIGFLGAGSMAEALIRGLLSAGLVSPDQVLATNRQNRQRLDELASRWNINVTNEQRLVASQSDILVLACKPKDVVALLNEVGGATHSGQVLLSVAAGISTASIADLVRPGVQVVRSMPNTSSLVRESATAICAGPGTGPEAMLTARAILGAVGKVVEVPEAMLDAVTGLSGTGPAYIYLMMESLTEAGVRVGLPADIASSLARQTIIGAAKMLAETSEDPAVLRQKVTSPGGTTMAAMQVLNESGFTQTVVKAVARATERSQEMGAAMAPQRRTSTGD